MCITQYHVVLVRKNAHVHNYLPRGKGPPLTPNQGERTYVSVHVIDSCTRAFEREIQNLRSLLPLWAVTPAKVYLDGNDRPGEFGTVLTVIPTLIKAPP